MSKHKQDAIDLANDIIKSHIGDGCSPEIAKECAITTLKLINQVTFGRPIALYQRALNYLTDGQPKPSIEQIENNGEYVKLIDLKKGFIKVYEYKEESYRIYTNNKEKFMVTAFDVPKSIYPNYFIENHINITEDSKIEYQIDLSGGKRYDAVIGLTNRKGHEGKFGFMQNGNDLFGNGYKFKNKQEALDAIKSNIKSAINRNESPMPKLKIDGKVVEMFTQVK